METVNFHCKVSELTYQQLMRVHKKYEGTDWDKILAKLATGDLRSHNKSKTK
jgi:hypothetical protein